MKELECRLATALFRHQQGQPLAHQVEITVPSMLLTLWLLHTTFL